MPKPTKPTQSTSAAKKKAERKPSAAPSAPAAKPLVDPLQSAAAAAAMVAHKLSINAPTQGSVTESTSFKNLKESLNKPHAATMGSVLDKISPGKAKTQGLPLGGGKQVGHNQTFGADASRRNVPRRTGG